MTFVSLNGTNCRVDIYKRGYEGNEVVDLVGAANPFEYEEEDSEDTLNSVIRYRTGYLRIIEDNYGDLDELYPLLNTDRYIEFYYGENLDFNGFIQAQEFENPWNAGSREVELPVISPLGLAAHTTIDWTQYNPPRWMTIDAMINDMLSALDGGYQGYYFPQIITKPYALTKYAYVNSLTFCPYGNDYDKTSNDLTGIYDPQTVEDALTEVCTWLGLILHDVPNYVIFQRLDYKDQYRRRDAAEIIDQLYTPIDADLSLVSTVAASNNSVTRIMPMSKIKVEFAGEIDVPNAEFSRCQGYALGCGLEGYEFCSNTPMIDDFTGTYDKYGGIDNDGMFDKGNVFLGAFGQGGLQDMVMFRPHPDWRSEYSHKVATYNFYEWNGQGVRVFFNFRYGESMDSLNNPSAQPIAIAVRCGNYYYNGASESWVLNPVVVSANYARVFSDGRTYCEVWIPMLHELTIDPLTVEFYATDDRDSYVYTISDIGLKIFRTASDQYLNRNFYNVDYEIAGVPSINDGTVTRGLSIRCYTLNRIRMDNAIYDGYLLVELVNAEPNYPYLLQAQDRLQVSVKMPRQDYTRIYLDRLILWGSLSKWRVIACGFKPWDDTYILTLHHSTTFDT